MKAEDVAHALKHSINEGTPVDTAVSSMVASLKKRGALNLLPSVLTAVERIIASTQKSKPMIIVGKPEDSEKALQEFKKKYPNLTAPTPVVDTTLIGGYVLKSDSERVDGSFKGALLGLYHNITRQ